MLYTILLALAAFAVLFAASLLAAALYDACRSRQFRKWWAGEEAWHDNYSRTYYAANKPAAAARTPVTLAATECTGGCCSGACGSLECGTGLCGGSSSPCGGTDDDSLDLDTPTPDATDEEWDALLDGEPAGPRPLVLPYAEVGYRQRDPILFAVPGRSNPMEWWQIVDHAAIQN